MQMGLAAMVIDADHAALEHGKHVLDRIGVNDFRAFVAAIFLGRMLGRLGDTSARQLAGFSRSQIIRKKVLDTVTVVW